MPRKDEDDAVERSGSLMGLEANRSPRNSVHIIMYHQKTSADWRLDGTSRDSAI